MYIIAFGNNSELESFSAAPLIGQLRLRVVSNLGDSGEIRARTKMGSREETRHEEGRRKIILLARLLAEPIFARAHVFRRNRQN